MTADSQPRASEELLFVDARSGRAWLIVALAAVASFGVAVAVGITADTAREWGAALLFAVPGALAGWFASFMFKSRDDASRFYADRVETFRGRQLLHTLKFADVHRVAYVFRPDACDEFLRFSGPGRKPLVTVSVDTSDAEPASHPDSASDAAITPQKLQALRDELYDVVARRILSDIAAGHTVAWFGPFVIAAGGLVVDGRPVPWSQIKVAANDRTGDVVIVVAGRDLQTSMIEDNVVAGLKVLEELKSAHRGRATASPAAHAA